MTKGLTGEVLGDIVQNELTTDRARDNVAVTGIIRHSGDLLFVILNRHNVRLINLCLQRLNNRYCSGSANSRFYTIEWLFVCRKVNARHP